MYNLVNKANLVHNFSYYAYSFSLHVSGDYVPIIRRNNCIYTTFLTCFLRQVKGKVKCTLVQALKLCTGRMAHRGSIGIALLYRH